MIKEKTTVFLTVGNKKQKELCEKLLATMSEIRFLDIRVVSDDDYEHRLGSGGAVLNILRRYYQSGQKMIIINSGGMSKRSINYAVRSKAFASVPYNEETISLLEFILKNSEKIVSSVSSGVLICCSDIVVRTDDFDFLLTDNTGICVEADFSTASNHGVMVCDDKFRMTDYLHKKDPSYLEEIARELCLDGMLVDTGITYFTDEFSTALKNLALSTEFDSLFSKKAVEICLYSDIISLLSENISREDYLKTETKDCDHHSVKELLFDSLSAFSMNVCEVVNEKFIHFGSSKEALRNIRMLTGGSDIYTKLDSFIDEKTNIGNNSVLDGAQLNGCSVGENCLVTDIALENISIGDNKSVCGIRISDGSFVSVICDIDENPKDMENDISKWEKPRFYKGKTFSESLEKYYNKAAEQQYSMQYCMDNADYDYFHVRRQYLSGLDSYVVSDSYLRIREKIVGAYFESKKTLVETECLKDKVEVCLPLRVNLSGTWTDAMPYCIDNGGQVINMAVLIDGKLPVKVSVERLEGNSIEFCSDGNIVKFNNNYKNDEDISDFNLHKAALKTLGITPDTKIKNGFRLTTQVKDIDKGSGLGTSSILLGGCIIALSRMFGIPFDEKEVLRAVFVAEQIMNTGGGWQDQAGGLTPGIKSGSTIAGTEQYLNIDYIDLPESFMKMFSERLVLMPSGQRHFGRFIVNDVVNRYLSGNEESLKAHKDIRKLNDKLIKSIEIEDEQMFCSVVNEHRELLKKISPKVTNPALDEMMNTCMQVAYAASPCGAGGGGYLLVVLKENISLQQFKEFVAREFPFIKSSVKKIDIYF